MKIILKTLKQVPHEVEYSSDEITIAELKKLTETQHKIEADTIKLVFNGTVLKDESTLKSYGITEGIVLVMMISKAKVQNKPQEPTKSEPVKQEVKKEETKKVNEGETTNVNQGGSNNINTTSSNTTTNTQPKQIKDYSSEVNTLVEMGFPKEYALSAIKAAKGNVSIAIEFLYNGIPDVPIDDTEVNNGNQGQSGQVPQSESDVIKRIASLVKILCANDPSQLQNIILGLQQTQPELLNLIKAHETEFKNLISQPVTEEDMAAFQEFNNQRGQMEGGEGGMGTQGGTSQDQSGRPIIRLSKSEFDAVQRIKEFGFSEMDAAQAYFACDKNEEMAINFLLEMKSQDFGMGADYSQTGQSQQGNQGNQDQNKEKKDEDKDKDKDK